jgi:hypothetical protein
MKRFIFAACLVCMGVLAYYRSSSTNERGQSSPKIALSKPVQSPAADRGGRVAEVVGELKRKKLDSPYPESSLQAFGERKLADQMRGLLSSRLPDVSFTDAEREALGKVYADYQTARGEFEASIATVETPNGHVKITVPEYPDAGDRLRDLFFAEIQSAVGREKLLLIQKSMASDLDALFRGFGHDVQQIEIASVGDSKSPLYRISRAEMPYQGSRKTLGTAGQETFEGSTATYTLAPGDLVVGELAPFAKYLPDFSSGG